MFNERITTPVNPLNIEYINTLVRPTNEPDLTLTMLGLACLKKKVKGYSGIYGASTEAPDAEQAIRVFHDIYTTAEENEVAFYYVCYYSTAEVNLETLTDIGFKHKETVENIVKEKFKGTRVEVLYNELRNEAVVFVNSNVIALYHLILSFLPLYYPNIYKTPVTRDDPEVKVLSAMTNQTSSLFKQVLSETLMEFQHEFYVAQVSGLIKLFHQAAIEEAAKTLSRAKAVMDDYRVRYADAVQEYRNAIIRNEGVLATEKSDETEEELINYLTSNDKIRNVKIKRSTIYFTVATTLSQFSLDAWETFVRNGEIFKGEYGGKTFGNGPFSLIENRKLLFNSIFSDDPLFEIKMAGNYSLDIRNHVFNTNSDFNYELEDPLYENYLPNPHLKLFGCLGQYHGRVIDRLAANDLETAMELCVYSAGSVDLDETIQTFRPMMGWIMDSDKKILRRFDGVDMTPKEALLWLISRKEKEHEAD